MKRLTLGILVFMLFSLAAVQRGLGQSYAYVCNFSVDTVTAIDLETRAVVATVAVGDEPYYVVLTPDGSRAYVTNRNSNTVSVIDTGTNTVIETIPVGVTPWQLAITPDGSRVYVVNYGQLGPGSVSVISTATDTVIATIPVSNWPRAIAMTPDGTRAYIACQTNNCVSVIDTVNNVWLRDIFMPYPDYWPGSIAISPDGAIVYVGNVVSNSLAVINTATDTIAGRIALPFHPDDIEFKPDGLQAYVTTGLGGTLSIVDVLTGTVTGTIEVCPAGKSLGGIAMKSGGDRSYIAGQGCGMIGVIDTAGNTLVASIPAGPTPLGIAIVPPQNRPPVADLQSVNANAGEPTPIGLTATDEDGDVLTYEIASWPSGGTLIGDAPNLTYTADIAYYGEDSFTFKVNDGKEASNEAKVMIAVNHVPVADSHSAAANENAALVITLGETSDVDGDPLTYHVLSGPVHGSLDVVGNVATYAPADFYYGPDSFTFQANDTKANSNVAAVSITVKRVFTFVGFESPVDNPDVVNSAKAGSTVPVKWLITDLDGTPISDPASFASLTSYSVSCTALAGDPVDEVETYAGASGLQYIGAGHWQFNWKTPKTYVRQCRVMVLKLADGSTHSAYFNFK